MNKLFAFFFSLLIFCAACTRCADTTKGVQLGPAMADETVALVTQVESLDNPLNGMWRSYCSGVWISSKVILTAAHCVDDEKPPIKFIVHGEQSGILSDPKTVHFAKVGVIDSTLDLATIVADDKLDHPYARLAFMSPPVGSEIFVLGHPRGQYWTQMPGTIGGYQPSTILVPDLAGPFTQIIAPISPGNSGGPVFDSNGNLIAIVSFGMPSSPGIAYAIHLDNIRAFLFKK